MTPTVLSLFSGVGGFDLGLERAGFEVIAQCDNDPFCNKVLAKHWPEVTRFGDVRDIGLARSADHLSSNPRRGVQGNEYNSKQRFKGIDLIVGGFPCQDLSVAGKRAGLDGERSGLWFEFHRILSELRPAFCLIENVPGLLSACGCDICTAIGLRNRRHTRERELAESCRCDSCELGRRVQRHHAGLAFSVILAGLGQLWPAVGWAVLDSQHFGVPQRRRRVYIVGGSTRESVQQILSLCEGGDWHPAKGREAREGVAATIRGRSSNAGVNEPGRGGEDDDNLVVAHSLRAQPNASHRADSDTYIPEISPTLDANMDRKWGSNQWVDNGFAVTHTLSADGFDASEDGTGRGTPLVAYGLDSELNGAEEHLGPLKSQHGGSGQLAAAVIGAAVRRLTPVECARLQGFPDRWTCLCDKDACTCPDGPQYKAYGNAVSVPVIEYLGTRIREAHDA